MRHEIVFWLFDGLPPDQRFEVGAKEVVVEGVGMIPVELFALL